MGRDNEFKSIAGKANEKPSNELIGSLDNSNAELAKRLRAHNFNFGYTEKSELEKARVKSI